MKKRILSLILTIVMLVGLSPTNIFSTTATAAAATAVTLTDNSGEQTVITAEDNTSGTGYTYDAETNTLTLNNWTGRKIQANGDLNIHLKGTNTITMADPASGKAYGIHVGTNSALCYLDVTADEGAVLNINGTNLTKSAQGIAAHATFHTGTVNVNITGSDGIYGIYGITTFAEGESAPMTLNVTVTDTDADGNDYTTGIGNGSLNIQNCANDITINVTANTMEESVDFVKAISQALYVYDSAPVITATAKRIGATKGDGRAYDGTLYELGLNEGGEITFNGYVRVYDAAFKTNINTVTTTPANDGYFWEQDKDIDTSNYYYAKDAATGNTLNKLVFAYSETPEPIKYYGESRFQLSGMKVGNSYQSEYFRLYVTGLSTNATGGSIRYSIESGTLPEGLTLSTSYGYISGRPTAPCAAGSVTVKVTDTMGTISDTSDDRTETFVIHYDAVTTNKPVTGLALDKDSLVLDKSGTGTVIATVTPSDASYTNLSIGAPYGFTVTASEAVEGVITLTVTAGTTAGVYVIGVTTIDTGIEKTFTVYVKESTPAITLDADDNCLRGFSIGVTYKISATGVEDYTFTANEYSHIALLPEWAGKTLTIIRTNAEANCNSNPCTVSVETKSVSVSNGTGSGDYIVGSIVTIEANDPATGYNFAGWTGTEGLTFVGGYQPSHKTIKFYMPDEDINLEATYTLKTYTVYFSASSYYASGSMDSVPVQHGDYVLPDSGFVAANKYKFKSWIVNGNEYQPGDTVQITANTTITANFTLDTDTLFNVTVNSGTAKVDALEITQAAQNDRVNIVADTVPGKKFSYWLIVKGDISLPYIYNPDTTFTMVYEDVEITAIYECACESGIKHTGQPADCYNNGWRDYYECDECGRLYSNESLTASITNLDEWKATSGKISAKHSYYYVYEENAVHNQTTLTPRVDAHYRCYDCEGYFTILYAETTLAALTGETPAHSFGDWILGSDEHWKSCKCGLEIDRAEHSSVNGHNCDTCNKPYTTCIDSDRNHACDICSEEVGTHIAAAGKHTCNYCGKPASECVDSDRDHACDVCDAKMGEHKAAAGKHTCGYCGETVSSCADENGDYKCDVCGENLCAHIWIEASCTEAMHCSICGVHVGDTLDHNFVRNDSDTGYKCNDCGHELIDYVCPHMCHRTEWYYVIIWGIFDDIYDFLGVNDTCECGQPH